MKKFSDCEKSTLPITARLLAAPIVQHSAEASKEATSAYAAFSLAERKEALAGMLRLLSSCGTPSYKLKAYGSQLAGVLSLQVGSFALLPGLALLAVGDAVEKEKASQPTSMTVSLPGGLSMEKMEAAECLVAAVCANVYPGGLSAATVDAASLQTGHCSPYGPVLKAFAFGCICLTACLMFGTSPPFVGCGFLLGCTFGLLLWASERGCGLARRLAPTFDFWCAALLALAARGLFAAVSRVTSLSPDGMELFGNFLGCFLPAIIWILPGFAMSNGFVDLLGGNRALGVSNIFSALFVAFTAGLAAYVGAFSWGPTLGSLNSSLVPGLQAASLNGLLLPAVLQSGAGWLGYELACFLCCIFFVGLSSFDVVPGQQLAACLAIPTAAYAVSLALASYGEAASLFFAAFTASCLATALARTTGRSSTPAIYLGIVVLAPGAKGATACFLALQSALLPALAKLFDMLTVALALALGVVLGRALLAGQGQIR